jgi:hypothetical protein
VAPAERLQQGPRCAGARSAQVVFMFGEIDCREGLLLAVDKLKYPDLQAAMRVLVDIYLQARSSSHELACSLADIAWAAGMHQGIEAYLQLHAVLALQGSTAARCLHSTLML